MTRLLSLLLVLVIFGFLSALTGWPWIILWLALAVGISGLILLRSSPGGNRLTFFFTAFTAQVLALAWLFSWTLGWLGQQVAEGSLAARLIHDFAGTVWLQNFWGLLFGIVMTFLLFVLLLGLVKLLRLLPDTQATGVSKFDAFTLGIRRSLGIIPAEWIVRNGEISTIRPAQAPYPEFTGPGVVEVQRDHAVMLERSGQITRIIYEGMSWLGYMERMCMVVPLFGRGEAVVVRNVSTNDPLMIEELNLAVFHKVNPSKFEGISPQQLKETLNELLKSKVWSPSGNSWSAAVRAITEREARNAVADYDLEAFLKLDSKGRANFKTKLAELVNKVTDEFLGVTVTVTGIGGVAIPDLAAQRFMQRWTAGHDQEFAWQQADLQRGIDSHVAEGRRDVLLKLSDAMRDAGDYHTNPNNLLLMSMIEQIQRSGNNPSQAIGQEMDMVTRLLMLELLKNMGNRGADPTNTV